MRKRRVAYVALVWPRSTIFGKVSAQQAALTRMELAGSIEISAIVQCCTTEAGDDLVLLGTSRLGRLTRSGRLHSAVNLLWAYPSIYRRLYRELGKSGTDVLYIRKPPIFDLVSVAFMAAMRRSGTRVVMEIPTYPYDAESHRASALARLDRMARRFVPWSIDAIATFSRDREIFGVQCVNIENAADIDAISVVQRPRRTRAIRATVVAALEPWHRVDRILSALIRSWESGDDRIGTLNIVGTGPQLDALKQMVATSDAARGRVVFHGFRTGEALDAIFQETDIAVGNLEEAKERGVGSAQALKHREYAARGLPFIYGLPDWSFSGSTYAIQVPDGPLDLNDIVARFLSLEMTPEAIRADAERFRWEYQFIRVLGAVFEPADLRIGTAST